MSRGPILMFKSSRLARLILVFATVIPSCVVAQNPPAKPTPATSSLDLSGYELRAIYSNDFSTQQKIAREEDFITKGSDGAWRRVGKPDPGAEWIAEGWGGSEIRNGGLRVAAVPFDSKGTLNSNDKTNRSHMVVWNRKIFPSNILFEFEMDPGDSTSGLTIVMFSASGKVDKDIFDLSLPPRRADYKTYHSGAIANYSDSYWSRNTEVESKTNRLRKNPCFELVAEAPSLTDAPHTGPFHVRVMKYGGHIEVEVNAHVLFRWDDPGKPLGAGRIGLRSMSGVTLVTYDEFRVSELVRKETL